MKEKVVISFKKFINYILSKCKELKIKETFILCIPFVLMHIFIAIISLNISYIYYNWLTPILFSISWIILFIGICLSFKQIIGKVLYVLINTIFLILYLVNGVYYSMMSNFFDFSMLSAAGEGSGYIIDSLKACNPLVYVGFVFIIISIIFGIINFPKKKKTDFKLFGCVLLTFLVMHFLIPFTLGKANTELTWSSWRNARNIYNSYNDINKAIKVSGFYEFEFRNFYITYLKTEEAITQDDIDFLESASKEEKPNKNLYTGLLKDKNLIIVQLEGTDDWILNKTNTPTLYKMKTEAVDFKNHYSFYNGGGSTFNSEFAINTGFVTPFSYNRNAYTFNKNSFPYSLANLLKEQGYSVNAFHMNSGEFYSRTVNYINWGYDNYYGLSDMIKYDDSSYELDRELMLHEEYTNLMFPEGKFFDYIITYSGHVPFTTSKAVCKMLIDIDKESGIIPKDEKVVMTEEECVYRQNRETDYMMELLMNELEKRNLISNTVVVVVTDHYLYTLDDLSILDKYKETSNNLINHTPFFIWSKNLKHYEVNKVTSQLNILPTLLNMYGLYSNKSLYIGEDALSRDYDGIAFFSDYSWYDGNVYVDGGLVTNAKRISEDDLENKNYYVNYLTKKNDLTLKYNYFNR